MITNKNKKLGIVSAAFLAATAASFGSVMAEEDFSYTNGTLTTVSGGAWTAFSGAGTIPVAVTDGAVGLVHGSGTREDVSIALGDTMGAGDVWYYSMDVKVSGGNTDVYFAMLMQSSTVFNGRLFVTSTTSGDFTFGVSGTSTVTAKWSGGLSFNTTYKVVVAYDYDAGNTTLWVDPVTAASTSVTFDGAFQDEIVSLGLRQASGNSTIVIDNIAAGTSFGDVVAAIPEPSSFAALAGVGALGFCALRRRRSV